MRPPEFPIDPEEFWRDPYPSCALMQALGPLCHVPQLNAVLLTRRDDIFVCEKNIAVFSSVQPSGLMNVVMGDNLMRKDGEPHAQERKDLFPALSPKTVRDVWKAQFVKSTRQVIGELKKRRTVDLVAEFAMPVSGEALRHITGLTNISAEDMDRTSQAMIDGVGNYLADPDVEIRWREATAFLDEAMDVRLADKPDDLSMLSVLTAAGQSLESIRANIKVTIGGGQNEPRDAIAGASYALLKNPEQLDAILSGQATWLQAFEEYARWISPIGMAPRRVAQPYKWQGLDLQKDERVFLMYGAANRDASVFDRPDEFDIFRDTSKSIAFGAGPHFCAGAWASRTLIADVALPMLFEAFPNMTLIEEPDFGGWAFRGPLSVRVKLG